MPHPKDSKDFFNAVRYAVKCSLTRKKTSCDVLKMQDDPPERFCDKMLNLKESLVFSLRINTFERQCPKLNDLLIHLLMIYWSWGFTNWKRNSGI